MFSILTHSSAEEEEAPSRYTLQLQLGGSRGDAGQALHVNAHFRRVLADDWQSPSRLRLLHLVCDFISRHSSHAWHVERHFALMRGLEHLPLANFTRHLVGDILSAHDCAGLRVG
eukprot:1904944-Prymnesium_polylepis.1